MYDPGEGYNKEKLPTVNVTIQNTISSQALDTYNHAFGSTLGEKTVLSCVIFGQVMLGVILL